VATATAAKIQILKTFSKAKNRKKQKESTNKNVEIKIPRH